MEGSAIPPEVLAPSDSNPPKGEEPILGLYSLVVRDDDGLTRPF